MGTKTIDHAALTKLAEAGVVCSAHSVAAAKPPDRAPAIKAARAAAAYTKWFKVEVQVALDDNSPTIPHDEAMRQARAAIKLA